MAKKGQKEALRDLLAAAEALNGKISVIDDDNLHLIVAFGQAALAAKEALKAGDARKAKLEAKISESGARTDPSDPPTGTGSEG